MNFFSIKNRLIGDDYPPVVIAEIGINHEGSLTTAFEMVDSAIKSGAEIIKHQTHIVEDEMSFEAKQVIPGNANVSIYEIMKRCALSEEEEWKLMKYVEKKGAIFISTPFSRMAVDRLIKFNIPAFKIGSGECNNYPLIKYISKFKKPVILSTGMNSIESIRISVEILRKEKVPFALLHCTNVYPTPPEIVRIGAISTLKKEFPDAVVGLSDHTVSNYTCLGAVALGASILERHFTDNMDRPGPDIICSMDPTALSDLIEGSLTIFKAKGNTKLPLKEEEATISFAYVSVVAIEDIPYGMPFTENNIWVKRPATGDFNSLDYEKLLGKYAATKIKKGFQIKKSDVKPD
ncbi:MAG: N-acetylneuraminate synthase family protein [Flavobacteriaceae bacterium]|nr:N-acetylneuraminate synthase family protein [Flavobacteriaceae bacterium]